MQLNVALSILAPVVGVFGQRELVVEHRLRNGKTYIFRVNAIMTDPAEDEPVVFITDGGGETIDDCLVTKQLANTVADHHEDGFTDETDD